MPTFPSTPPDEPSEPSPDEIGGTPLDPPDLIAAGGSGRSGRRARILAPLTAAVAVAAVAAGVVAVRANGRDVPPAALHLVDGGTDGALVAQAAAGGGVGYRGFGDYRVAGTLPTGPSRAPVYTFPGGAAPADRVAALARALGLSGTPRLVGTSWQLTSHGLTLQVTGTAGWQWMLYRMPAGVSGPIVRCPVPGKPAPGQPAPGQPAPGQPAPGKAVPPATDQTAPAPRNTAAAPSGKKVTCVTTEIAPGGRGGAAVPVVPPVQRLPGAAPADRGGAAVPPARGSAGGGSSANGGSSTGGGSSGSSAGKAGGVTPADPDSTAVASHTVGGGNVAAPVLVDRLPTGPPPNEAAVRRAAAPVLAALGLDGAAVAVTGFAGFANLVATPTVDGLPTAGFETRLEYDGKTTLFGGSGWLGGPARGTQYPLVSAKRALDALPHPDIAIACTNPAGSRCPAASPTVVTGARLGLAIRRDAQAGALLVPAWLYDVRDGHFPLVAIAVDPAYLQPPATRQLPPQPPQPAGGANGGGAVDLPAPAPAVTPTK
jgi:hypothetical protein